MRSQLSVLSACLLLTVACAPEAAAPPPEPEIDLAAERSSLMAADRAWAEAYAGSDAPADVFADNVVDHATLLPPDAPIAKGRESIRETIAALESMEGFSVSWAPDSAVVSADGQMGYTIGQYQMSMAPEGSPVTINGKYLTVWEKQEDGSWMVSADMFNAGPPPEAKS